MSLRLQSLWISVFVLAVAAPTYAADHDNNVEWSGLTHIGWLDRRPLCPVDQESFTVLLRSYHFDLTAVRAWVNDGALFAVDATYSHTAGPYDIWEVVIPASAASVLTYYLEVTDGSDTDYLGPSGTGGGVVSDGPPASGWVINFQTYEHAPIGATPITGGGTVFKVWAPSPTTAFVRGQFNAWGTTNPMTKYGSYFVARVDNATYRQMYKLYFGSTNTWKSDARGRSLNPSDNYNTHIDDPFHYVWTDTTFQPPAFEDMIVYELHVGTFAGRNDPVASGVIPATYRDVAAHAADLADLGINVVELMPITEYPWDFSAGYNPVSQWAPEWKHGTPDDLKYLIDTLHQHGIAVVLDIVWNHFSGSDNYLWNYTGDAGGTANQIYFDGNGTSGHVDTPWGAQADFDRPEVRDYFADSALYWVDEFKVDGFRMDATDYMNMYQGTGWALMQRFNDELNARSVNRIGIAEQLPNDAWVTRPTSLGGAGFDCQWYDAFVDNLRSEILDAGWNQANVEMWKIRDILYGGGQYLNGAYVLTYFEGHDEAWPESGGSRIVTQIDPSAPNDDVYAKGRIKLAYGVLFFAPGIPMILQGSEWLENTAFGSGSPAGADRLDWSKKTTYADIYKYFQDIIATRKTNGGLRANAGVEVHHVDDTNNVIAWHRWDLSGNDLVIVANFSNGDLNNYRVGFPQNGTWSEILNSQAAIYGGNNVGNGGSINTEAVAYDGMPYSAALTIPQMGVVVFRYGTTSPGLRGDLNCDDVVDFADINPFVEAILGGTPCSEYNADINGDGFIDFADINPFVALLLGP